MTIIQKRPSIREVLIEEDYVERDGKVYWKWRLVGKGRWNYRLTPYNKIPYVKVTLREQRKALSDIGGGI